MAIRDIYSDHDDYDRQRSRAHGAGDLRTRLGAEPASLLRVLWRRKLTLLACILLSLAGAVAYIALTPPRYLSSAAMLIDPRLGKSVGADPVQPGFIADTSAIDSQVKLFTSQTVLARVAKVLNLTDDPEFNGSQRSLWQRLLHPNLSLDGGVDLKALEDAITIKRPERTYVVQIDVLARDPKTSAAIANALTQAYIDDQVVSRVGAARDDTTFVRQRLDNLSAQIRDAENAAEAFKIKNDIVDTNGLRSNEQQVSDLTKARADARSRASDAKARLDEVRAMARRGQLDGLDEAVKSQTVQRLRQSQAETAQNVAKLSQTLGSNHPALLEARAQQARIARSIGDELRRLEMASEGDYKSALDHQNQILADVGQLKKQSAKLNSNLVPLEQLERNVTVLRATFNRFAQVNDNLAQQEAQSPPGRVIAVARPSVSPASPKKTVVGLVSLSAGVFVGLTLALLGEGPAEDAPSSPVDAGRPVPVEPAPARPRMARRYWDDHDDDA